MSFQQHPQHPQNHHSNSSNQQRNTQPIEAHPLAPIAHETITLVSRNNYSTSFDITINDMFISPIIVSSLLANPDKRIFLINSSPEVLSFITDYIKHHHGINGQTIDSPLKGSSLASVCEDLWDAHFIDNIASVSHSVLCEMAIISNDLGISSLTSLTAARIAASVKSHPLNKIRTILLGTENPQQPQQLQQQRSSSSQQHQQLQQLQQQQQSGTPSPHYQQQQQQQQPQAYH